MSDLNIFSNGLAYWAFIYLCLAVVGLLFLIAAASLLYRLFRLPAQRGGATLVMITRLMLFVAFALMGHFWVTGGPNKGGVLIVGGDNYFEPKASILLFFIGITLALIIQPVHRRTAQEKASRRALLSTKPWPIRHKWHALIFSIVLVICGQMIHLKYQLYENHKAFNDARATIDSVYSDVLVKVGKPDESRRGNSCAKYIQEFSTDGPITCTVYTNFIYGVANRDEATNIYQSIQKIVSSNANLKPTEPLSDAITDELVVNTYYHSAFDRYRTKQGIECTIKYSFDTPDDTDLEINNKNLKALQIYLDCSSGAKALYYPLDK